MTSLAKCFDFYNAKPRNTRWSWSAKSEDGKTVVLALWKDLFVGDDNEVVYDCFNEPTISYWQHQPGNAERIYNIQHAINSCDGQIRIVALFAVDPTAVPRKIKNAVVWGDLTMRITKFCPETGEFRAEAAQKTN